VRTPPPLDPRRIAHHVVGALQEGRRKGVLDAVVADLPGLEKPGRSSLNSIPFVGGILSAILGYVAVFVAGAMIVVALKALFETAR
jgi:hypothetical protein